MGDVAGSSVRPPAPVDAMLLVSQVFEVGEAETATTREAVLSQGLTLRAGRGSAYLRSGCCRERPAQVGRL